MKIEDAIKRYESWAEDDRIDVLIRKEHRQIADWLKELNADRPQKVVAQVTFDEEKLREIVKEAVECFKEEYEITDRPQGEWVRISSLYSLDRMYRCSVCGKVIDDMPMDEYYDPAYKGCPYCLTRMKGAEDDA